MMRPMIPPHMVSSSQCGRSKTPATSSNRFFGTVHQPVISGFYGGSRPIGSRKRFFKSDEQPNFCGEFRDYKYFINRPGYRRLRFFLRLLSWGQAPEAAPQRWDGGALGI